MKQLLCLLTLLVLSFNSNAQTDNNIKRSLKLEEFQGK